MNLFIQRLSIILAISTTTISPVLAQSQESKSILIGHNLTPTTHTLAGGSVTAGNYLVAVGLTDNLFIATSPWMYVSYNMYSVGARYRYALDSLSDLGLQVSYLKSSDEPPYLYQMEATNTSLSWGRRLTPNYRFQLSLNHMWFLDETYPYSLRREPYNDQPYQFSLTTLHETKFIGGFGGLLEAGCLGVNYTYPQIYLAMSFHYIFENLLVQLGVSANGTPVGIERLYTTEQGLRGSSSSSPRDFALHPEAQLQFYF